MGTRGLAASWGSAEVLSEPHDCDLEVRPGHQLEVVPGRVEQVDAAPTVFGVGLAGSCSLRVRPMVSASIADLGVGPVEVFIIEQVRVVLRRELGGWGREL